MASKGRYEGMADTEKEWSSPGYTTRTPHQSEQVSHFLKQWNAPNGMENGTSHHATSRPNSASPLQEATKRAREEMNSFLYELHRRGYSVNQQTEGSANQPAALNTVMAIKTDDGETMSSSTPSRQASSSASHLQPQTYHNVNSEYGPSLQKASRVDNVESQKSVLLSMLQTVRARTESLMDRLSSEAGKRTAERNSNDVVSTISPLTTRSAPVRGEGDSPRQDYPFSQQLFMSTVSPLQRQYQAHTGLASSKSVGVSQRHFLHPRKNTPSYHRSPRGESEKAPEKLVSPSRADPIPRRPRNPAKGEATPLDQVSEDSHVDASANTVGLFNTYFSPPPRATAGNARSRDSLDPVHHTAPKSKSNVVQSNPLHFERSALTMESIPNDNSSKHGRRHSGAEDSYVEEQRKDSTTAVSNRASGSLSTEEQREPLDYSHSDARTVDGVQPTNGHVPLRKSVINFDQPSSPSSVSVAVHVHGCDDSKIPPSQRDVTRKLYSLTNDELYRVCIQHVIVSSGQSNRAFDIDIRVGEPKGPKLSEINLEEFCSANNSSRIMVYVHLEDKLKKKQGTDGRFSYRQLTPLEELKLHKQKFTVNMVTSEDKRNKERRQENPFVAAARDVESLSSSNHSSVQATSSSLCHMPTGDVDNEAHRKQGDVGLSANIPAGAHKKEPEELGSSTNSKENRSTYTPIEEEIESVTPLSMRSMTPESFPDTAQRSRNGMQGKRPQGITSRHYGESVAGKQGDEKNVPTENPPSSIDRVPPSPPPRPDTSSESVYTLGETAVCTNIMSSGSETSNLTAQTHAMGSKRTSSTTHRIIHSSETLASGVPSDSDAAPTETIKSPSKPISVESSQSVNSCSSTSTQVSSADGPKANAVDETSNDASIVQSQSSSRGGLRVSDSEESSVHEASTGTTSVGSTVNVSTTETTDVKSKINAFKSRQTSSETSSSTKTKESQPQKSRRKLKKNKLPPFPPNPPPSSDSENAEISEQTTIASVSSGGSAAQPNEGHVEEHYNVASNASTTKSLSNNEEGSKGATDNHKSKSRSMKAADGSQTQSTPPAGEKDASVQRMSKLSSNNTSTSSGAFSSEQSTQGGTGTTDSRKTSAPVSFESKAAGRKQSSEIISETGTSSQASQSTTNTYVQHTETSSTANSEVSTTATPVSTGATSSRRVIRQKSPPKPPSAKSSPPPPPPKASTATSGKSKPSSTDDPPKPPSAKSSPPPPPPKASTATSDKSKPSSTGDPPIPPPAKSSNTAGAPTQPVTDSMSSKATKPSPPPTSGNSPAKPPKPPTPLKRSNEPPSPPVSNNAPAKPPKPATPPRRYSGTSSPPASSNPPAKPPKPASPPSRSSDASPPKPPKPPSTDKISGGKTDNNSIKSRPAPPKPPINSVKSPTPPKHDTSGTTGEKKMAAPPKSTSISEPKSPVPPPTKSSSAKPKVPPPPQNNTGSTKSENKVPARSQQQATSSDESKSSPKPPGSRKENTRVAPPSPPPTSSSGTSSPPKVPPPPNKDAVNANKKAPPPPPPKSTSTGESKQSNSAVTKPQLPPGKPVSAPPKKSVSATPPPKPVGRSASTSSNANKLPPKPPTQPSKHGTPPPKPPSTKTAPKSQPPPKAGSRPAPPKPGTPPPKPPS